MLWNYLDLECPSQDLCEYPSGGAMIEELHQLLTSAADILTSNHPIWTEIKIFNNIQERYKRILHCDKFLQLLIRVGRCLRKMVLLNLSKSYLDLAEQFLVPLHDPKSSLFLPSRQHVEYVLIRTQSAAKLISEAVKYSREAFCKLIQKLRIGHLVLDLVTASSVTARLNIMFKALLVQMCDIYKKLLPWREKLKEGNWKWPDELDFPEDLEEWVKLGQSDEKDLPVTKEQIDFLTSIFKKKCPKNSNNVEVVTLDDGESDGKEMESSSSATNEHQNGTADYGEILPREEAPKPASDLTCEQKALLCKLFKAQSYKRLRSVWDDVDIVSQIILPRKLTSKRMKIIEKIFCKLKEHVFMKKNLNFPVEKRKKSIACAVNIVSFKIAKIFGFTENQIEYCHTLTSNKSKTCLKPVKTFVKLKKLYKTLYNTLKSKQELGKCKKLRKVFNDRRADIKLLNKNNDKAVAKKLIFCTSKVLLAMCQNGA